MGQLLTEKVGGFSPRVSMADRGIKGKQIPSLPQFLLGNGEERDTLAIEGGSRSQSEVPPSIANV